MPEVAMALDPSVVKRQPSKNQRTEPNKLQRRDRTYSFSPGRQDSVRVGRRRSTRAQREADALPGAAGLAPRFADHDVAANPVRDDMLWRVPTLHNKRDGDHLPRKLSSKKRRKEDRQREAEIKAMSHFAPVRAATEDWMAGRPIKKESRRVRTGFGGSIRRAEFDKFNRSSDISLPLPESIDTALSSDSDYMAYKVSALEALAPRPTLRCTSNPRWGSYARDAFGLIRRPSQQRTKLNASIPEETLKAHKRVDDLANDLSASDLRELMERDQRRRERKQQSEQQRSERRIARRAEKQKAVDAEAARHGRESPPNLERGVLGRENVGLGLDPASAIITSSRRRHPHDLPEEQGELKQAGDLEGTRDDEQRDPLAAFHRVNSNPLPPPEPASGFGERHVSATPTSPPPKVPFRRKLSRSKPSQRSEAPSEKAEQLPGPVIPTKAQRSWTSFFKWGNKNKRDSGGPSSFSNTSRETMQVTPIPTAPVNIVPRRMNSGVPKRTMSRFREDLPELPTPPPVPQILANDAAAADPVPASAEPPRASQDTATPSPAFQVRQDSPTSEQHSVAGTRETPSTFSHPDEPGVSPEPQAMSLASIDSEGSWFSGRLAKKRKSSGILDHGSGLALPRETPESDSERHAENEINNDDMNITDDDYLSGLTPTAADRPAWNRKSTGEARPSSDWEEEEEAYWGSVRGRQPKVVRSAAVGRVKSREGLLNSFGEEGEVTLEPASPDDNSDGSYEVGIQRATSIDYGKIHARRISAGSARLLSITPRSSVDAKSASPAPVDKGSS